MCGRFALGIPRKKMAGYFGIDDVPEAPARYNIAPGQLVETVRQTPGGRELALVRWGLTPSWSKDASMTRALINARAETLAEKPSFKAAFRRRRCLVPAQGFYEWRREGKTSQPWFFSPSGEEIVAMAGLWEEWTGPEASALAGLAIVTCAANELVGPVHERMPVLVEPKDFAAWLDPAAYDPARLAAILAPRPWPHMTARPVGRLVNAPGHDGPELIAPLAP